MVDATINRWSSLTTVCEPFHRAVERGDVQADAYPVILLESAHRAARALPRVHDRHSGAVVRRNWPLTVVRAASRRRRSRPSALELAGQRRVMVGPPWWSPFAAGVSTDEATNRRHSVDLSIVCSTIRLVKTKREGREYVARSNRSSRMRSAMFTSYWHIAPAVKAGPFSCVRGRSRWDDVDPGPHRAVRGRVREPLRRLDAGGVSFDDVVELVTFTSGSST